MASGGDDHWKMKTSFEIRVSSADRKSEQPEKSFSKASYTAKELATGHIF